MPRVIVKGLPMLGSDEEMKKLRTGVRNIAKASKAKVTWTVSDDVVAIDIATEPALLAVCKKLDRFRGVVLTKVEDQIDELLLKYGKPATATPDEG